LLFNPIAGVLLLLSLFGEQFQDSLALGFVSHDLVQQVTIALNILASNKPVDGDLPWYFSRVRQPAKVVE
jgi:hypothetical protein